MDLNQFDPPPEIEKRFWELRKRFESHTITHEEYREMLELTEMKEILHAERLEALSDLARERGITLPEIMKELGIQFPLKRVL